MAEYKKLYADAPPVLGIVTDFAVHAFWIHQNIEAYAVATEAMRDIMIARGIAADRIAVSGIPVNPNFARGDEPVHALRERLGLPRDRKIVLMMGGGLGIGPLGRMLRALESIEEPLAAVVVAGRNPSAERRVLEAAEGVRYPVRVLRFVNNVYDYMHAADALITKPGGLSTAEALAAEVPMVLCKPLPGQEERNARVLADWGAAIRTRSLEELAEAVDTVLTDSARREQMIAAARRFGRPQAARDAAAMIVSLSGGAKEVVA
jgi:processive 1,2-diacylglycerol beta-glucosyltransferase